MVLFEEAPLYLDQFFTACGPTTANPFESANCTVEPGVQLFNDTFDNGGGTLANPVVESKFDVSIYPNPTSEYIYISSNYRLNTIEMFDLLGKQVLTTQETKQLKINYLPAGMYLLKVYGDKGTITKKIVLE